LVQHIVVFGTVCSEFKQRGDMRSVNGLKFRVVPAAVLSYPLGPLINAALYLLLNIQYLSRIELAKVIITTVSVRAMIGRGIGEKCS